MHPLTKLAKTTIEEYVLNGKVIEPPENPVPEMVKKAGVFVSLKMKGELRGCIGTFQPTTESVAAEIIQNAISAATQDPRFPSVNSSELEGLDYSVDLLSEPEKVNSRNELDPEKFGVIVKCGERKGLLLPDLEGVNTVDEQISIASTKAGIYLEENIELYRFEVRRYK